jgi:4-hydroxybenzoate polyprenyltransferase
MTPKDFLNFIRWKNVIMICLIMFLIKYVLFAKFDLNTTLDTVHYALLVISTLGVAIAGYIINDVYDVEADKINKPNRLYVGKKLPRTAAYHLFIGFNSVGLLIGMYLSYHVGHTSYFIIYVLTSLLLYQYAKYLKKKFLIGNILVSFAVFLSIILPVVFDLMPVTNALNESVQLIAFRLVVLFGIFGFFLTFLREVVKDLEDEKGDAKIGARTLPIVLGVKKTKVLVSSVATILCAAVLFFAYLFSGMHLYASIYLSLFVAVPLIYFALDLWKANNPKRFHRSSAILKIIMLLGILTILLI